MFYASEVVETAVAETAFYRLLFFSESPGTPWPRNALEFTAFESRYATKRGIDLLAPPFARHAEHWTHLTDYTACLALADAAHQAGIEIIRYQSVRDPAGGANLALLSCGAFAMPRPTHTTTWRLVFSDYGVKAICDQPDIRLGFSRAIFAGDPRMARTLRPPDQGPTEPRRMPGDMIGHEGGNEEIGMVVAIAHVERQRNIGLPARLFQEPWPQAVIEKTISLALIHQ